MTLSVTDKAKVNTTGYVELTFA